MSRRKTLLAVGPGTMGDVNIVPIGRVGDNASKADAVTALAGIGLSTQGAALGYSAANGTYKGAGTLKATRVRYI